MENSPAEAPQRGQGVSELEGNALGMELWAPGP